MPLIDTFLKLMLEKRAERLVIAADQIPFLLRSGETIELSMPALPLGTVRRITLEIAPDAPDGTSAESHHGSFRAADGAEFGYLIQPLPTCRIEIHTLSHPPAAETPTDDLLAAAIASFSKPGSTPPPSAAPPPFFPAHPPQPSRPDPDLLAIVDHAISLHASDIFLSSEKPPRVRKQGAIAGIDAHPPTSSQILDLLPDEAARSEFQRTGSADFAVRWDLSDGPHRIRINVFRHHGGVAAALRPIPRRIPPLADLNLPPDLLELAAFPNGLVLVAGTSGSGKSTTLAALIDHLNRTRPRHIITIEDPIEYEHREIQCLIHQREVGPNVESFATGLRAALRENPDVILLGELRDLETITAALTAAETGHLVFATLHSGSATAAVNRIVDVFPGHQQTHVRTQLSLSLRAVVSQRLVPARAKGLVPVIEKLLVTPAVANGIREGHDHFMRNAMLTGTEDGMVTLERSLSNLVRDRIIDRETAFRHAHDPKALQHLLG
jgi:twitching motility protein PilT